MVARDLGPLMFDADAPFLAGLVTGWHITCLTIAFVLNLFGLIIMASNRHVLRNVSVQLLLAPMANECFKCGTSAASLAAIALQTDVQGRFIACQTQAALSVFAFTLCILLQANVAIDRYLVVTGRRAYTYKHMVISSVVSLVVSIPLALGYLVLGNRYVVGPSRGYCISPWATRDPPEIALNLVSVVVIAGGFGTTLYCQFVVFRFHRAVRRDVRSAQNFAKSRTARDVQEQESMFWRFFGLSVITAVGWAPLFATIVYSVVSGNAVPADMDAYTVMPTTFATIPVALLHLIATPAMCAEIRHMFDTGGPSVRVRMGSIGGRTPMLSDHGASRHATPLGSVGGRPRGFSNAVSPGQPGQIRQNAA